MSEGNSPAIPAVTAETPFDISVLPEGVRGAFDGADIKTIGDLGQFAHKLKTAAPAPPEITLDTPISAEMFDKGLRTTIERRKVGTIGGLADMLAAAEKLVGQARLGAPAAGKLVEWMGENKQALGVPESADGYEIAKADLPEGMAWDDKFEAAARSFAHERNIPQDMFRELVDFVVQDRVALHTAQTEARQAGDRAFHDGLAKMWGTDKDKNIELAQLAVRQLGLGDIAVGDGEEAQKLLDKINAELGTPATMELFRLLGSKMQSASVVTGDGTALAGSKADARRKIDQLTTDTDFQKRLGDREATGHAEAVREWEEAHRLAFE